MKNTPIFQIDNTNSISRVWIISDTHFGAGDGDPQWIQIAKQWRDELLIPTIIENAKPGDYLFHLGDVFDKRTSINLEAINFTIETFEILGSIFAALNTNTHEIKNSSIASRMITYDNYNLNSLKELYDNSESVNDFINSIKEEFILYPDNNVNIAPGDNPIIDSADYNRRRSSSNVKVICGNHDLFRKHDNTINSISILKWLPNVEIIYQYPKIFDFWGNKGILVPWVSRNSDEQEIIKSAGDIQFYFAHTSVQGAFYSGRRLVDHGLTKDDYGSFKRVWSGHIHTTQTTGNVRFVGNPYEMTRNDSGNPKSILLIDFESEEEIEFENDVSPRWIRATWEAAAASDDLIEGAKVRGDRIDIDISEEMADTIEVRNLLATAEDAGIDMTLKWREKTEESEDSIIVYDSQNTELPVMLEDEVRSRVKNQATADKVSKFILDLYKRHL